LHFWVTTGSEVCYDRLGCFTDDAPWGGITGRPGKILPKSPEVVNTRFLLYTNKNQDTYQEVVADASSIKSSNFRTDKKTRFIIHGFTDTGENSWLSNMCKPGAEPIELQGIPWFLKTDEHTEVCKLHEFKNNQ
uniref:Triacylglycerol lipase n=1 Tax=Oryctolagus cuniculus TaxID=9986 RepID=A0A5F9CUH3_RABIT